MARILYFAYLVDKLGRSAEEIELPADVRTVGALLEWLRRRGGVWEKALADGEVKVTVNKQFASAHTPIDDSCEIAIVSAHPW